MSRFHILTLVLLIAFLNVAPSFSADPSEISPSPVPEPGSDAPAPLSNSSSPEPSPSSSPSPSPSQNSPPAPPPADLAPNSSPAPAPGTNGTNSPADASNISHEDAGDMDADDSAGGMSKGKKVGIAIGVIAGVCIVGVGALVYKKRQQNIQRGQFGYAARRDFL